MAMHQQGVENVVASSGTALTEEQIRAIHRFTENIVVIYDGDAAGIKASQRGIDMLLAALPGKESANGKSSHCKFLHPVVEINFRMNMGILAILLYNKYGADATVQLTPPRPTGFEARLSEGKLQIGFRLR